MPACCEESDTRSSLRGSPSRRAHRGVFHPRNREGSATDTCNAAKRGPPRIHSAACVRSHRRCIAGAETGSPPGATLSRNSMRSFATLCTRRYRWRPRFPSLASRRRPHRPRFRMLAFPRMPRWASLRRRRPVRPPRQCCSCAWGVQATRQWPRLRARTIRPGDRSGRLQGDGIRSANASDIGEERGQRTLREPKSRRYKGR